MLAKTPMTDLHAAAKRCLDAADPAEKLWFYSSVADMVAERLGDCAAARELRQAVDDVAALAPVV